MPSVLFVCTANQFRSPIAAACFTKLVARENIPETWRVESAGTWAQNGLGAPGVAILVASLLGLAGLERHLTRQVDQGLLDQFDLIVVMEMGHKEALCNEFPSACQRIFLLSEIADGIPYDIPDPVGPDLDPADIGREISFLVAKGKEKMIALAESLRRE